MTESPSNSSSRSIGRMVVAGLILLLAAYVLLKIVIGIALAIAGPLLLIVAIIALVWAWRVLF
jgi:protein-S-isoprenylcysteine O-methyltransferase Ste14